MGWIGFCADTEQLKCLTEFVQFLVDLRWWSHRLRELLRRQLTFWTLLPTGRQ